MPARVLLMEASVMQLTDKHRRYWRKNLNITAILLVIWFVVTFVVSYYARELSFNFFGWPFSFWMGAQGVFGDLRGDHRLLCLVHGQAGYRARR